MPRAAGAPRALNTAYILLSILGCQAAGTWNYDLNRLEADTASSNNGHHTQQRSSQSIRSVYAPRLYQQQTPRESQALPRTAVTSRQQYNPQSQTRYTTVAPFSRNIYRSLEDPASFYKNRVFMNMTEHEKSQFRYRPYKDNDYRQISNRLDDADGSIPRLNDRRTKKNGLEYLSSNPRAKLYTRNMNNPSPGLACVRCPADRTVKTARGRERVALPPPALQACGGEPAPLNARFSVLYGPSLGALLSEGTHLTVGNIMIGNRTLQLCNYRVDVVVRRCPLPLSAGLELRCPRSGAWGSACHYSCTPPLRLRGPSRAVCGSNLRWTTPTPTCENVDETSCETRSLLRQGRLTCSTPGGEGSVLRRGASVSEGTTCTVRCRGRALARPHPRTQQEPLTCHLGQWNGTPPACSTTTTAHSRRRRHRRLHALPQTTTLPPKRYGMSIGFKVIPPTKV